jgi:ABC-2 type transport system ATP-binding protein
MTSVLEVGELKKYFEDFTLGALTLEIPKGRISGIFGPNGAGKSTLIKLLAGQIPNSSGSVRVFGHSYQDSEKDIKNRIGYVAQEPYYYWSKSVTWTARFASKFFASWDGARFYGLLDEFGINRFNKVKDLSRGKKTLLSIAIALSHKPELLILDEPTAGLDMVFRRSILARLREFTADEQKTVIVSSHLTDGLDDISDSVYFLHEGKLILEEEKEELTSRWKWIHFKEGSMEAAIEDQLAAISRQPFHSSGLTGDFASIRKDLEDGLASGDVKVENASLDDILITLMEGE